MPGRIRIDLVIVGGIAVGRSLQHPCAQRHDLLVGRVDVVDPEVKVNLLLRSSVRPVRWDMVGRELDTHPRGSDPSFPQPKHNDFATCSAFGSGLLPWSLASGHQVKPQTGQPTAKKSG